MSIQATTGRGLAAAVIRNDLYLARSGGISDRRVGGQTPRQLAHRGHVL